MLTLNFFNNNAQRMTAAERRWIVEGTPELNQPRCFVNALTLKWKSKKYIFIWERGYVFVSTENETM